MYSDRVSKIILSWIIGFCSIAAYLYTSSFILAFMIIMLASPLRNNIYDDESFSAASRELPRLSKLVAFLTFFISMFFVYDFFSNGNEIEEYVIFLLFAPVGFLYFYRDYLVCKKHFEKDKQY